MSQLEELSYEQIATKLGVSVRSVGRYMREAMLHCCRMGA
jgi:RNA polymerase sigma-70 factor (ECF subfamily)